ncbi:1-pyrroline-5-carboxylate dehydrogenase [Psychrobacter pygoscelis]|uniref:1-pyrroline-5-carboxylate dehydrogenase n=1 Tax=Psychrobacter pygoscelis TaxID=2488563 RepID=UPI00103B91E8|nr:1-pyrroline-5-carboxylate dehydrogenase [Psychrobacter pygoscelis]
MATEFKKNHAQICEAWRLLGAIDRAPYLQAASPRLALLTGNTNKAKRLFSHLIDQAPKLDEVLRMNGATGESNDLYLSGRGKTMIIGSEGAKTLPVLGQMMAALLAGNEVILHYPSQPEICTEAVDVLYQAGIKEDVISIANDSQTITLLHMDKLAQVAVVGTPTEVQHIAAELAKSDGILTRVIAVTDTKGCREMLTPDYLYNFITERVKTINTTAIGGNASLLELGVGE